MIKDILSGLVGVVAFAFAFVYMIGAWMITAVIYTAPIWIWFVILG